MQKPGPSFDEYRTEQVCFYCHTQWYLSLKLMYRKRKHLGPLRWFVRDGDTGTVMVFWRCGKCGHENSCYVSPPALRDRVVVAEVGLL